VRRPQSQRPYAFWLYSVRFRRKNIVLFPLEAPNTRDTFRGIKVYKVGLVGLGRLVGLIRIRMSRQPYRTQEASECSRSFGIQTFMPTSSLLIFIPICGGMAAALIGTYGVPPSKNLPSLYLPIKYLLSCIQAVSQVEE
jgi:hypothetical protein